MKRKIDTKKDHHDVDKVVNLSAQSLSSPDKSILSKGLNLAPTLRNVLIPQIIVTVACDLKEVEENKAVGQMVIGLLRKTKLPPTIPSQCKTLMNSMKE